MKKTAIKSIYVIVGNGISDLGKGWLTASIGHLYPKTTIPIKIDPFLNLTFPKQLGINADKFCNKIEFEKFMNKRGMQSKNLKISDDFNSYHRAGLKVYPECNIIAGDLIRRFLLTKDNQIRSGEIKKKTFTDLSFFLAEEITSIVKRLNPITLLIEIGGTVEDKENFYISSALRFLERKEFLNITPEIVLLTYFEYAEFQGQKIYRVKTQNIRRGIAMVRKMYCGLPIKACFVRRRYVPDNISNCVLEEDIKNVCYETQFPPDKIFLMENVKKEDMLKITELIKFTNLF